MVETAPLVKMDSSEDLVEPHPLPDAAQAQADKAVLVVVVRVA